jgi:formylglycine-generating enzyme required for sulfatase activity
VASRPAPTHDASDPGYIEPAAFRPPGALNRFEFPAFPWVPLALAATFAITALVIGYLLLARSVNIEAEPADARLDVASWFVPRIGSHWLLTPGEHGVRATATGYKPLSTTITVTHDTLQNQRVVLTPLPGRLTVGVAPVATAEVRIDGQPAGTVPGTLEEIEAGTRTVEISAERYLPFTAAIEVRGKRLEETLDATLAPAWADFTLRSQPPGATVSVDGKALGLTPYTGELIHGRRRVTVSMKARKPWSRTIDVVAGQAVDIPDVALAKADGILEVVTNPPGAAVTVDGRFRGEAPVKVAVTPDREHRITVMKAGYAPGKISARAGPDEVASIGVQLAPELATVNLLTEPADAELLIDGQPAGNATQKLSLPTHEHELIVRAPGYASYRTIVTPRKGFDKHLRIKLKTAAEMAREAAPPPVALAAPAARAAPPAGPPGEAPPPLPPEAEQGVALLENPFIPEEVKAQLAEQLRALEASRMRAGADAIRRGEQPPPMTAEELAALEQLQALEAAAAARGGSRSPPAGHGGPTDSRLRAVQAAEMRRAADAVRSGESAPRSGAATATQTPIPIEGEIRTGLGQVLKRFDGGRLDIPQRPSARLTRPFYFAAREVTNAEYRRFISNHVSRAGEGQELNADRLPVVGITWEAAAMYCNWLSRRDSLPVFYQIRYGRVLGVNPDSVGYRLPTEAEWDWVAARSADGEALRYPWGGGFPPRSTSGNFADESAKPYLERVIGGYDDGYATTAPVGSYPPNSQGLYDLAGNVAEWVHDYFAPIAAGGTDPLGPSDGAQHVVRGSSWASADETRLRAGHREASGAPRPDLGFRIARYLR